MNPLSETLAVSASGMHAQAFRLRLVAENIANADTPGYRRKIVSFQPTSFMGVERAGDGGFGAVVSPRALSGSFGREGAVLFPEADRVNLVALGPVSLDRSPLPEIFDPGHILADDSGKYLGSNVDLVIEIADSREAARSYEANLRLFEQARTMAQNLLGLLRR